MWEPGWASAPSWPSGWARGISAQANSAVFHGLLLYLGCWILFLLFGLFACRAYMDFCTDTAQVAEMGVEYLRICCCFSFGMCAQFPLERILQSTGHPMGFMIIQGSGAVINLIFDPILIFGFDMGVAGAAAATVAGQIIGALIGVFLAFRIRRQFPLSPRGFRLDSGTFAELTRVAAPAILMQSLSSVMSLGLNAIFRLWSETGGLGSGRLFQAAELCLYARLQHQQRAGLHHQLQLRRIQPGAGAGRGPRRPAHRPDCRPGWAVS